MAEYKFQLHWPEYGIEHGEFTGAADDSEASKKWMQNKRLRRIIFAAGVLGEVLGLLVTGLVSYLLVVGAVYLNVIPASASATFWLFIAAAVIVMTIDDLQPVLSGSIIRTGSVVVIGTLIITLAIMYYKLKESAKMSYQSELVEMMAHSERDPWLEFTLQMMSRRRGRKGLH